MQNRDNYEINPDSITVPAAVFDSNCNQVNSNRLLFELAGENNTHKNREPILSEIILDSSLVKFNSLLQESVKTGKTHNIQCTLKNNQYVHILIQPVQYKKIEVDRTTVNAIVYLIDSSSSRYTGPQRRETNEQRRNSDRLKSEFISNISHEIKTPLHTISGMSELLQSTSLSDEQHTYLKHILHSTGVLQNLINNVMDISRLEAGKLEIEYTDTSLREIIEEAATMVAADAQKKGLELSVFVSPGMPTIVESDPLRLRQVLLNLLSNAVKFTANGSIWIKCEIAKESSQKFEVEIRICDTGPGIPEEKQSELFTSFTQADSSISRKYGGSGLGLSIVKCIIDLLDGSINIESTPGSGSCFTCRIPVIKTKSKAVPAPNDSHGENDGLLVVSADMHTREFLKNYAEYWHFNVTTADSASVAKRILLDRKTGNMDFTIIVIDEMLNDLTAWELGQSIHDSTTIKKKYLIMLSSISRHPENVRLNAFDIFDTFVIKPVLYKEFQSAVFRHTKQGGNKSERRKNEFDVAIPPTIRQTMIFLIIDDHIVNREILKLMFEKTGFKVLTAESGQKGLQILEQNTVSAVFLDIHMPKMDGYAVYGKIRKTGKQIPVIAVTAGNASEERNKCFELGMKFYLPKPFKQKDLYKVLRTLIDEGWLDYRDPKQATNIETEKPVDMVKLEQNFLGKKALLFTVIKKYMKKTEEQIHAIESMLQKKSPSKIWETAHAIKGGAANLQAEKLAKAAAELETHSKQDPQSPSIYEDLAELKMHYKRFKLFMENQDGANSQG